MCGHTHIGTFKEELVRATGKQLHVISICVCLQKPSILAYIIYTVLLKQL